MNSSAPDWSLVQSFLSVAETGSLSAAAQALGHSQPTLGRHIRTLEEALAVELFTRHPRGLTLTEAGARLLPEARAMRQAMTALTTAAEAQSGQIAGTVRIACSVFMAHHMLPPILADLRQAEPDIQLVISASDDSENLLYREADIAIRMYRPRQLDLIARHLGDIEMGCFAARRYLDRAGLPQTAGDLMQHDLIGFDRSTLILDQMRALGFTATESDFALRCDTHTAYWAFIRAGCGIGFTQTLVGRADPAVEELPLGLDIPTLPVWLAAQADVRHIPRVDRIWTALAEALSARLQPA